VEQAALVADLPLLLLELVDQTLQRSVVQRAKIRERFHASAFRRRSEVQGFQQRPGKPSTSA